MKGKMQIVHFTDPDIGSLDWELPPVVAKLLSSIPTEFQVLILAMLENQMRAHLHTIIGAMLMGPHIEVALRLISENQLLLSKRLLEMSKETE